jgi:hypothetical protein
VQVSAPQRPTSSNLQSQCQERYRKPLLGPSWSRRALAGSRLCAPSSSSPRRQSGVNRYRHTPSTLRRWMRPRYAMARPSCLAGLRGAPNRSSVCRDETWARPLTWRHGSRRRRGPWQRHPMWQSELPGRSKLFCPRSFAGWPGRATESAAPLVSRLVLAS